jgi:XRE family transcriptional regulator, regulator of sulfur utilization
MMTRRDVVVAVAAMSVTIAAVALADSAGYSLMGSTVFKWNDLKVVPMKYGARRDVFMARTAMLERLDCHITTLNPGEMPHPPKPHDGEELMIIKEGTLEVTQKDKTTRVGPGSIIVAMPDEVQGMRNVGETPATYFVVRWFAPGTLKKTN